MPTSTRVTTSEERREQLLAEMRLRGHQSVAALSQLLGVSGVTIRKDLEQLELQGLLTRTHGGAVLSGRGQLESDFAAREQLELDEKRRIARAAAAMIHPGQTVFLDSSTTAFQVAKLLLNVPNLSVVTTGLYTAIELSSSSDVTVIIVGGIVRRRSTSLVNILSDELLRRLRIDIGFFGACGVTAADGLTEIDLHESQAKQHFVRSSRIVVGIADSTKFGNVHIGAFALPEEINHVITDQGAPVEIVDELRALDIAVDLV